MHISVIIPTCGRLEELALCLQGLEKQTLKPSEIIVVNDSAVELKVKQGVRLVQVAKKLGAAGAKLGSAGAKDIGANMARGEILAFLDDDCVPAPDWLIFLIKPFASQKISVVAGRIREKKRALAHRNWRDLILNLPFYPLYFWQRKKVGGTVYFNGRSDANLDAAGYGFCDWGGAGNLAVRKNFFDAAGGFDGWFLPGPNFEEPDLCLRIQKKGGLVFYQGQAVVMHNPSAFGRLTPDVIIQNLRANEIYFGLKNIAFRGPLEFFGFFLYQGWQILIYSLLALVNRKYWLRVSGKIEGAKYYLSLKSQN